MLIIEIAVTAAAGLTLIGNFSLKSQSARQTMRNDQGFTRVPVEPLNAFGLPAAGRAGDPAVRAAFYVAAFYVYDGRWGSEPPWCYRMSQKDLTVPDGWSIRSVKFHRDFVYWGSWALEFLSSLMPGVSPTPPAADVSYTLYRTADGALKTVRLPGDHAPDALVKTMLLTDAPPQDRT